LPFHHALVDFVPSSLEAQFNRWVFEDSIFMQSKLDRPQLVNMGSVQHLGQSDEFRPATIAASPGQFCRVDLSPSGMIHKANLSLLQQFTYAVTARAFAVHHLSGDCLRYLLRFAAIRRNRPRRPALGPSNHV
jgi:hypothetical protein